jgi:uncharacterized C2H2 Zn-finger protein
MGELGKKRNPGILGWNKDKIGKQYAIVLQKCPHCWYQTRSKSVLSRHINQYHFDK